MKGCLVLQRRFAYIGHELAILLKEKHGIDEFCAYTILRDSYDFLRTQKDISYTGLLLDEEVQGTYKDEVLDPELLQRIEREYGSVWKFIDVDRVIRYGQLVREYPHNTSPYSYEEMLRMVQVYVKRIEAFLDREKPDFVFTYIPGAMGMLLLYTIAQKRGIPVITVVFPLTRDLITVSERFERLTWVDAAFTENLKKEPSAIARYKEAYELITGFRNKPVIYSEVYNSLIQHGTLKQFEFLFPAKVTRTVRSLYGLFYDWVNKRDARADFTTIHPASYLFDRVKRKLRNLRGARDLYDECDAQEPFVFFPLHFEPELAVYLLSPFETDQVTLVRRLARSVPAGMYVYVKEHPQMSQYRPRRFYKELKKIPNVRLLRPELSGFDIIRASKLVAIISGAAGWEACLLGKAVITFGEPFYNTLPFVAHSSTPEELPALVKKQLEDPQYSDESMIRFVAALLEDGAQCDLLQVWEFERDRERKREKLADFAALVARKARLVTGTQR